jgi:hypothetical protein
MRLDVDRVRVWGDAAASGRDDDENTSPDTLLALLWAWSERRPRLRYMQALTSVLPVVLAVALAAGERERGDKGGVSGGSPPLAAPPADARHAALGRALLLFERIVDRFLSPLLAPTTTRDAAAVPDQDGSALRSAEVARLAAVVEVLSFWDPDLHLHLSDLGLEPELWAVPFLTTLCTGTCATLHDAALILDAAVTCSTGRRLEREGEGGIGSGGGGGDGGRFFAFLTASVLLQERASLLAATGTGDGLAVLQRLKDGAERGGGGTPVVDWPGAVQLAVSLLSWSPQSLGGVVVSPLLPGAPVAAVPHTPSSSSRRRSRASSTSSVGSFTGIVSGALPEEDAAAFMADAMEAGTTPVSRASNPMSLNDAQTPRRRGAGEGDDDAVPASSRRRTTAAADGSESEARSTVPRRLRAVMSALEEVDGTTSRQPRIGEGSAAVLVAGAVDDDDDSRLKAAPLLLHATPVVDVLPLPSPPFLPRIGLADIAAVLLDLTALATLDPAKGLPHPDAVGSGAGVVVVRVVSSPPASGLAGIFQRRAWARQLRTDVRASLVHVLLAAAPDVPAWAKEGARALVRGGVATHHVSARALVPARPRETHKHPDDEFGETDAIAAKKAASLRACAAACTSGVVRGTGDGGGARGTLEGHLGLLLPAVLASRGALVVLDVDEGVEDSDVRAARDFLWRAGIPAVGLLG